MNEGLNFALHEVVGLVQSFAQVLNLVKFSVLHLLRIGLFYGSLLFLVLLN